MTVGLGELDMSLLPSKLELYLSKPNQKLLFKMKHPYNRKSHLKLGYVNELTFTIPYMIDMDHQFVRNPYIDMVRESFLVKAKINDAEEWYIINQITKTMDDSQDIMNIHCFSLGYELKYKTIHSYTSISYNCKQVLADALNGTKWAIGFIDPYFNTIYRSFNVSEKTVLDFVTQDLQSTFNATVTFDTVNRKINFYRHENIGQNKGLKVKYGHYLLGLEKNSLEDEICTRLRMVGNNDLGIQGVNPTGKPYFDDYSFYLYPFERDVNRNVISSSNYFTDSLSQSLLDYNQKLQSKLPVEKFAELGTSATTVIISNHGCVTGDYIINRTNGYVKSSVTVVDANTLQVNNPYNPVTETLTIANNQVYLSQTPYQPMDVKISGYTEITSGTPTGTQYIVNYQTNTCTFDVSQNGLAVQVAYDVVRTNNQMGDTINIFKDGTFGKLLFLKSDYQTQLATKQADMASLNTQKQQILDSNAVLIQSGQSPDYTSLNNVNSQIASKQTEIDSINAEISNVDTQISLYRNDVDMNNSINFTSVQLDELSDYIKMKTWSDSNYIYDLELFYDGLAQLQKMNTPQITYKVDIINFLESIYEQRNWDKIVLGDTITIEYDRLNIDIQAQIVEVEYDFEAMTITLTISNVKDLQTDERKLAKYMLTTTNITKDYQNSKVYYDSIASNFDNRNDRIAVTPADPTVANDGTALSYVQNTDGSVNIIFNWNYNLNNLTTDEYNIDGFIVWVMTLSVNDNYVFGATTSTEVPYNFTADRRSMTLPGVPANKFYTFGVQAYRHVDTDVNPLGIIRSNIIKSTHSGQDPYQPTVNVNYTGQIDGVDATEISQVTTNFTVRNDRIADIPANPANLSLYKVLNTDGSADISFSWDFTGSTNNYNVDGFLVYIYTGNTNVPYIFGTTPTSEKVFLVNPTKGSYMLYGVSPDKYFTFGIRAYRDVDHDVWVTVPVANQSPGDTILGSLVTATPNPYQPATVPNYMGQISGTDASTVATSAINFNNRNDRINTIPANPTIDSDGTAVDHTINTDGSANISFEWQYNGTGDAYNIDGFAICVYQSTSSSPYTFGTDPSNEQTYYVSYDKKAVVLYGVPANKFYTFGCQAYRDVDNDISSSGQLRSSIIKSSNTGENPYQPSTNVAFNGDITGTINGISASVIATATNNFNSRNDRMTTIPANPVLATDGSALTTVLNIDGSANITFNWTFNGTGDAYDVDGFVIKVYSSTLGVPYTFGTNSQQETSYICKYDKRSMTIYGTPSNRYYSFAIEAYRDVDNDININGILYSSLIQCTASGQNPLLPSFTVTFTGNVSDKPAPTVSTMLDGFGGGNDGAFASTGNVTFTVSQEDASSVIKQYSSFTLNAGHTLTTDKRCRGLFIFVQGDCVINGTINMSGKSAKVSKGNSVQRIVQVPVGTYTIDIPAGGAGGNGGNGGDGQNASPSNTTSGGGVGGVGSQGSIGNWFGGGFPGCGGGGGAGAPQTTTPGGQYVYGGNGGSSSLDDSIGNGGQAGGGHYGGDGGNLCGGAGGSGQTSTNTYSSPGGGGGAGYHGGQAGQGNTSGTPPQDGASVMAAGGGLVVLIVKGNLTIGQNGAINCNGITGGNGGNGGSPDAGTAYGSSGGGGAQGGSGGGVVVLAYHKTYNNYGSIVVNGGGAGIGGLGGLYNSSYAGNGQWGNAGQIGQIITAQV